MLYYSEVLRNLTKRECFPAVESYPAVTSQGCKNEAKPQVQKKMQSLNGHLKLAVNFHRLPC